MICECEKLPGQDAELEDRSHHRQLLHEGEPPGQMPRLPCDPEATERQRPVAAARVGRHPDLPVRRAVAVRASDQLVLRETHGERRAQRFDVLGLVVQENVGQCRVDARAQCIAAPPDGRHGHQTGRSGFIESGIKRQAARLPQQILASVGQGGRMRKRHRASGPGPLGDGDVDMVTRAVVMADGDPRDSQVVEAAVLQLRCDDPPEHPVAGRGACGQRDRQVRDTIAASGARQLVPQVGKRLGIERATDDGRVDPDDVFPEILGQTKGHMSSHQSLSLARTTSMRSRKACARSSAARLLNGRSLSGSRSSDICAFNVPISIAKVSAGASA